MTGVPGGDVTLHAAITEDSRRFIVEEVGFDSGEAMTDQAERLADRVCGCQTYFDLERWRSRTTTACSEHIDDVRSTQPTQYVLPAAPEPRQDT